MTLRELRNKLHDLPVEGKRVPSPKQLLESGADVIAKTSVYGSELTVYGNGYIVYSETSCETVFPFPECGDYSYDSVTDDMPAVSGESFEDMDWHIRLCMEGADRITNNGNRVYRKHTISYSAIAEDWDELADPKGSPEDAIIGEEGQKNFESYLKCLTEKERSAITEHLLNGSDYTDIARKFGITRQAARDRVENGLKRIRKNYF